jgi:predicted amidohydrolase
MSPSLQVAVIQPDLVWLNPSANLEHLSQLLAAHISQVDLIVLPEMFTSGFTQYPESLLTEDSETLSTLDWLKAQAAQYQAAITGSIACHHPTSPAPPHYVNRLLFVTPEGHVSYYDKTHLFTMGGEHERYQAGSTRCIVRYRGWRILLIICYDLRFPVFCRNTQDYDIMLCVANWPQVRRHPWRTLLQARAIENQAYVIGANRVGTDGNGLAYSGDSMVVDYVGQIKVDGHQGHEQVLQTTLHAESLASIRATFPVMDDADAFTLL